MYDVRFIRKIVNVAGVVLGSMLFLAAAHGYPLAPDPDMTQGELCDEGDHDFVGFRYEERIPYCTRNVNWYRKQKIYDEYNIPEKCRHRYTIDHFIPLSLGGNNADTNLWPEHVLVKQQRAQLEQDLFQALSRGEVRQQEAIEIIVIEKMQMRRDRNRAPRGCDDPQT